MHFRAGDWVEVRSKEEILATLDKNGRLDGLPFMPQMFNYCGQTFQVYKRAHKTCDTVSGTYVSRRLANSIHLNHRCDGQAHGGCQAACLIFWKEAWLKPTGHVSSNTTKSDPREGTSSGCTEGDIWRATQASEQSSLDAIRYVCQATELLNYTQPLKWWDARQYVEDLASGNVTPRRMMSVFTYFAFFYSTLADRRTLGRPARWLHEFLRPIWRGKPMPRARGKVRSGKDTPCIDLKLQPGDLVRVKPFTEILATIDSSTNSNRGLTFDAEMVPNCGKTFRVLVRVEKFIDEKTGFMRKLKTPAVILDGVHCQSRYSEYRLFCPRSIYAWWREIWLERVPEAKNASDAPAKQVERDK